MHLNQFTDGIINAFLLAPFDTNTADRKLMIAVPVSGWIGVLTRESKQVNFFGVQLPIPLSSEGRGASIFFCVSLIKYWFLNEI